MLGVLLATAMLAADAASPPTPPPPARAEARAPAKDPNALVCHSETSTGSRMVTRVCMTAHEAELRRRQDREALRQAQGQSTPAGGMMMGPMGMPR